MKLRNLWAVLSSIVPSSCSTPELPITDRISMDQLETVFERLVPVQYGLVIVSIAQTEHFVQFSGGAEGIQMDFPLITKQQQALESEIRAFFAARDLVVIENLGSEGSRFLDVDLPADAGRVAALTRAVLTELFGATSMSQLEVASEGLEPAA